MFNLINKKNVVVIMVLLPLLICLQVLPGFTAGQQPIANSSLEQQVESLAAQLQELQAQLASQNQIIESNTKRLSGNKRDFQRDRTHFQNQEQAQEEKNFDQTAS